MKNKSTIILALLVVIGICVGVYYYFNNYKSKDFSSSALTTVAETTNVARTNNKKVLLAKDEADDFSLYIKGEKLLLEHNKQTSEFSLWNEYIDRKKPTLYYNDFNNDGKKELAVRAIGGTYSLNGKDAYFYNIYILTPSKQKDGSYKYTVDVADRNTWKSLLTSLLNLNVRQLTIDKSRIQIAMANSSESIAYDEKTGITTSKFAGYARAALGSDLNYCELVSWEKGYGDYVIENNQVTVKIPMIITYNNNGKDVVNTIGYIHCAVFSKKGIFMVMPGSVYFVCDNKYKITDPRKTAKNDWVYKIKNSASYSSSNKNISNIDAAFKIDAKKDSAKESLTSSKNETGAVESIKITNKKIVITAKSSYSFVQKNVDLNKYAVYSNKGTSDEYKINSTAKITTKNSKSVLTILLDKSYPKSEVENITVEFGV